MNVKWIIGGLILLGIVLILRMAKVEAVVPDQWYWAGPPEPTIPPVERTRERDRMPRPPERSQERAYRPPPSEPPPAPSTYVAPAISSYDPQVQQRINDMMQRGLVPAEVRRIIR